MPDDSESKPLLDLSELRLMPQWVSDFSKTPSRPHLDHEGGDTHDRRGPRDDRRGGFPGDRRDGPPRGDRKPGGARPPGNNRGGDARSSGPRDDRRGPPRGDRDRRPPGRDDRNSYNDGPRPVPGIAMHVEPDTKATEAMANMIRTAGKAYSVFDAARLVLASGDRFHVRFTLPEDSTQRFYAIPAESSLWLSKEEALGQFLHGDVLKEYYRIDEIEMEEPKGNFTSVAICGFSGEYLGPPSHHSYQTNLHKLHRERFSNMAFEDYKRRVRTESTPEAVEKWKESQKKGLQWVWLKGETVEGVEPVLLKSRAEMEAHFRKHHADELVREVKEATVTGNIPKKLLSPALYLHLRSAVDEARKHLLQTAQLLCTGFEQTGLKLFKRRGGKLWVSRTRPRAIDTETVLSVRIAKIIEIVKGKPGITTKELVETIAPAGEAPVVAETTVAPEVPISEAAEATSETLASSVPEVAASHALTDEQLLVLKDLHWLNSEGYVIEYADGVVYPGVTEPPPPKPKVIREVPTPAAEPEPINSEAPTELLVKKEPAEVAEVIEEEVSIVEAPLTVEEEIAPEAVIAEAPLPVAPAEPEATSTEEDSAVVSPS